MPLSDEALLEMTKRIILLSEPTRETQSATWRLMKIQDLAQALMPRLQERCLRDVVVPLKTTVS